MKITERDKSVKLFSQILTGQVFKHMSKYYMKVVAKPELGQEFNAVNLHDGKAHIFSHNTDVVEAEAELIVMEKR